MENSKPDTPARAPVENSDAWQQRYDDNSTRWERGALNPAFEHWRKNGAFGDKGTRRAVIIPGCGRSPEPLAFARLGHEVTALDFAPAAVEAQTKAFADAGLNASIQAADVLRWVPENPVDMVYDQTCLCALSPTVWPDYARQLHLWLKPGGRLFVLFMQTGKDGGPPYDCPLETMRPLFGASDWVWPKEPPLPVPHSSGKTEIATILTRRGAI